MTLPKHLAIIMDGNGRWAQAQGRPRTYGHVKGTRVAKKIITECSRIGVKWLTLYAFSSENWLRPPSEVGLLMAILKRYLSRETQNLVSENIRISVAGEISRLPTDVREALEFAIKTTAHCTGLQLVFCLSYGSRQELVSVAQKLAQAAKDGRIQPSDINEEMISAELWTAPAPPPDFIIRTSGEERLSNFLLWQAAYAEFLFTETLWPDFNTNELHRALLNYSQRQRRFGGVETLNEQLHETTP